MAVPESVESPAWMPVLDAFSRWLEDSSPDNARVEIVLSNRFVRHVLIPWSPHISSGDEASALAQACFESQYGDMSAWTIRSDTPHYGCPSVASAIETEFLNELRRVCGKRLACRSIEPQFSACWNQSFQLIKQDAVLIVADSGAAVVATLRGGQWNSVRSVFAKPEPETVISLARREALLQGFDEALPIYAQVPELPSAKEGALSEAAHWLPAARAVNQSASPGIDGALL